LTEAGAFGSLGVNNTAAKADEETLSP